MPAASNTLGRDDLAERSAQHLAPLTERRAHELEQRVGGDVDGGGRPRRMSANADSTLGRGTNTLAGTVPTMRAVAQYATFTLTAP